MRNNSNCFAIHLTFTATIYVERWKGKKHKASFDIYVCGREWNHEGKNLLR